MPPIVSFIGWHNSGKTTLASQVVRHLHNRGYTVAVIKSTKEHNIDCDQEGTDTEIYRRNGAAGVMLVAPDQMLIRTPSQEKNLPALVHRYFADVDIVIAEGFKHARRIAKVEVNRGEEKELLRDQVTGVIAVATDRRLVGDYVFRLDESRELADFLEKRFLAGEKVVPERVSLLVDGKKIILKDFVQDILANTVSGLVSSLKVTDKPDTIELRIQFGKDIRNPADRMEKK